MPLIMLCRNFFHPWCPAELPGKHFTLTRTVIYKLKVQIWHRCSYNSLAVQFYGHIQLQPLTLTLNGVHFSVPPGCGRITLLITEKFWGGTEPPH